MKALYIIGMCLAFLLIIIFPVVAVIYEDYYRRELWSFLDFGSLGSYSNRNYRDDMSLMAAVYYFFTFIMFAFYLTVDILGLIKVKRTTTKVLSIIGLSLTGIMGLTAVGTGLSEAPLQDIFVIWVFYLLIMLSFSIVGLVQAVKWSKGTMTATIPVPTGNPSDLDFFK